MPAAPSSFFATFWRLISPLTAGVLTCLGLGLAVLSGYAEEVRGLPFMRAYSLDEIGNISRSLRLGFDAYGRVAVMYNGTYSVLNDSTWVNRIDPAETNREQLGVIRVINGKYYYGGRTSWGMIEQSPQGYFRARPLVSPDAPAWTTVTSFNEIIGTGTGVYFYDITGVVYWDFARQRNYFFELPRVSSCFALGNRVFVSCQDRKLREIQAETGTIGEVTVPGLDDGVVLRGVRLDENHALLAMEDGRLLSFNGRAVTEWPARQHLTLRDRMTALEPLAEGGVALCVGGKLLLLFSADGSLRWQLPLNEFGRIGSLAANEPGVLWVGGENAVHKIFYASPLTSFGQPLGLPVNWPDIFQWNDDLLVRSSQTLFELESAEPAAPARFRRRAGLPEGLITCLAARDDHLLLGTSEGVFTERSEGSLEQVLHLKNAKRIEFVQPDLCVVLGSREIAALQYVNGGWRECSPRIEGVGNAPVRPMVRGAIWLELGGDQIAKLTIRDGRLALTKIKLPWSGGIWTNLGAVGPIVVISGPTGRRAFYDENKMSFCEAPDLEKLLNRSPYWISRVTEDESGTLWATHMRGVVTFTRQGDEYRMDAATFELRNDFYPNVTILPGDSVWITAGRSLFHVEKPSPRPSQLPHPVLVSLVADRDAREMMDQTGLPSALPQFAFDDNSLSFRFFSGTYAWRSPPQYQFRLGSSEPWARLDPDMVLRFPNLRDGAYWLEVRTERPDGAGSDPFSIAFVVNPPWYRTPLGYSLVAVLLLVLVVSIARWTSQRSRQRNVELERLVHERTGELEVAMEKLNEETRNAATHAERSRLAGEIHDSLQQGLSGTMLHLEATMTNPTLPADVQTQLTVIRNMLSYSREEVQQAVWNLESPLLQNSTLDGALRKLADYIHPDSGIIKVITPSLPVTLAAEVQHNLLRIAQEAITNAVKHAQAGHIGVTLQRQDDLVVLGVSDDGKGFDPAAGAQAEGHLGLRGIRGRARAINAQLQIISSPGTGTTILVTVPSAPSPA